MAEKGIKSDFNAMNVAELKQFLQERGVSVIVRSGMSEKWLP